MDFKYGGFLLLVAALAVLVAEPIAAADIVNCGVKSGCPLLRCPRKCGSRLTNSFSDDRKACYINCDDCSVKCRHRKPHCPGYGAMCFDPRIVGGDGVMFYFHGKKDQDFCLVSDQNLHINAHFIGKRPEGRSRDYTWVQALGFLFDSHTLTVAVKKVSTWDDKVDQLVFSFDGKPFEVPEDIEAEWTSSDGEVTVERITDKNSILITIKEKMNVALSAVPITDSESKTHNYQITTEDCFAHLDMQFNFYNLTATVNGVIGQTYQPAFKNPVKRDVPMPIMGGDDKFSNSGLLTADCKLTQFSGIATMPANPLAMPTYRTECGNTGIAKTGGIVCRR